MTREQALALIKRNFGVYSKNGTLGRVIAAYMKEYMTGDVVRRSGDADYRVFDGAVLPLRGGDKR